MALSTQKIIDELCDLIRFDYDAIGAYNEAIDDVREEPVRQPLTTFRGDHERHINELSALVRKFGGAPPEKPGLRGIVRKTMTKVAGLGGTEATLKAMRSNEKVLAKEYAERTKEAFPEDVMNVVRKNYADEQRHLKFIEDALRDRLWEHAAPMHP